MRSSFAVIATTSALAVFTVSAEAEVVTPQVVTPQVVTPEEVEPKTAAPRVIAPTPKSPSAQSPSSEAAPPVAPEPTLSQSTGPTVSTSRTPERTPTGNGPNGRPLRPRFPSDLGPQMDWAENAPQIRYQAALLLVEWTLGVNRPVEIVQGAIARLTSWNISLGGTGGKGPPPAPMPTEPINPGPPDRMNRLAGGELEGLPAVPDGGGATKDPNVLEDSELKTPSGQRFGDENPTWEE